MFKQHPKGLYILFFTEMWERFSYYGMRAILSLYMVNALLYDQANTSKIYGYYTAFDEKYPLGTIVLQKPGPGSIVKESRNIYLFISGGEPFVHIPALKGKSIRDAKFALERIGLKLGKIDEIPSTNPENMIFDQQYAEGTPVRKGESVGISISIGMGDEGTITVPDLIGKSLTEAEKILADSSLKVGKINYQRSFSLLPNTILDQYPSKNNKINPGDAVDLFVTKAAEGNPEEIIEE